MPEVALDFPRQWVEFVDPANNEQLIRADLTWLTSRWTCIFGRGCQGIDSNRPDAGCCVHGAHFSEKKDKKRVEKWVDKLTPELWEHYEVAQKGGWTEKEDGASKTRVIEGACIFHNSEGFEGGYGCALHHLANQEGVSFIETKPEVCWQLPLRRTYEDMEYEDGKERLVVVLGEYDRRGWGEGGHDFHWYCTGNTDAHVGTEPVYISSRDEIVALIGEEAYEVLAEMCAKRDVLLRKNPTDIALSPHPADPVP
ncbi:MAG: hypothetical protein ACO3LZ_04700 [Candidatus Nanopelagicales bacterium]